MRKLVWGMIAVVGVVAMSGSASARDRNRYRYQSQYYQPQQQQYYQPQQQYYQEERPGLFGRLWEMEQRKNAWLRQTFFGR